ncbi:MAG: B12-binding domain-containing radical SAM protein [Firmicutes bacterium HGW-Firmicutes-14]|nr:MAG: B12-binding domain-containing radical SAM protein [Firmicutes bacterium HGW-Firmicutes-14]
MKILLLEHPRTICPDRCNDIANTPLSSCMLSGYTAGVLKSEGHETEIVEGYMDRMSWDDIEDSVRRFKPDILGVHMVYYWQDNLELYGFLQQIKGLGHAKYITAYGFYPTIAYEDILQKCGAVDSVIVGEPELTFAELAANPGANPGANPDFPGLALRNGAGEIICKRCPLIEDLDSLPFPVRTEAAFRLPEVNIQGSRGCYGGCTFCYINPFYGYGSRWRGRSPENIVAEIDAVIEKRGVRDFYFTDPNFFGPGEMGQERARKLAALLKPRNIRFGIEGRVNDIHDETISALVEAGLRHILIGLESGKDSSLRRMNKMTTVAQNKEAIRILRKNGIEPNIGFIMFEPDAALEDIRTNFEFLKRNDLLKNLPITANVLYHHQIILKGTPAYKKIRREGRLIMQNDSSYEGAAMFVDAQVAALADIMRRVTNFLFNRMDGIWSGKVAEPKDAREKYAGVNRLLVDVFEDNLNLLQSGGRLTGHEVDLLTKEAGEKIDKILG